VDIDTGEEVATAIWPYSGGEEGVLLDPQNPDLARQKPMDYIEGFCRACVGALTNASRVPGFSRESIVGIGVDTTGSTPLPVDNKCQPVAFKPEFRSNLAAQAWLWKDHTSFAEAAEITAKPREAGEP